MNDGTRLTCDIYVTGSAKTWQISPCSKIFLFKIYFVRKISNIQDTPVLQT